MERLAKIWYNESNQWKGDGRMQWKREGGRGLCRAARLFLRAALLYTLTGTLILLGTYLKARAKNALLAGYEYPPLLEYIVASLLISLFGGWLIERVWRDGEKKK